MRNSLYAVNCGGKRTGTRHTLCPTQQDEQPTPYALLLAVPAPAAARAGVARGAALAAALAYSALTEKPRQEGRAFASLATYQHLDEGCKRNLRREQASGLRWFTERTGRCGVTYPTGRPNGRSALNRGGAVLGKGFAERRRMNANSPPHSASPSGRHSALAVLLLLASAVLYWLYGG